MLFLFFRGVAIPTTKQRLVAMDRGHGEQWIDFPCGVRGTQRSNTGHMEPAKSCDQFIERVTLIKVT
jgi:hypothetical protein